MHEDSLEKSHLQLYPDIEENEEANLLNTFSISLAEQNSVFGRALAVVQNFQTQFYGPRSATSEPPTSGAQLGNVLSWLQIAIQRVYQALDNENRNPMYDEIFYRLQGDESKWILDQKLDQQTDINMLSRKRSAFIQYVIEIFKEPMFVQAFLIPDSIQRTIRPAASSGFIILGAVAISLTVVVPILILKKLKKI